MTAWIFISIAGVILSIWGFFILLRLYKQGKRSKRFMYATVVGYISFIAFAVMSVLNPEINGGIVSIIILLPAFIAIVVLVNEYQK